MSEHGESILIVDDVHDHLALVKRFTTSLGFPCTAVATPIEAIEQLRTKQFGILVTDLVMPDMDGMELLALTRQQHPEVDVVVMTGFSKNYNYIDVINAGAADFITKPFRIDEYSAKLNRLLRERSLVHQLRQASQKAKAASKAKTEFIHTITHELRTPMNGIMGFTKIMLDMDLPDKTHEFLQLVADSSDRLMTLIDKMIDFANLESNENDLHLIEFDLPSFFVRLLPPVEEAAKRQGLDLRLEMDSGLVCNTLHGDPSAVGRILNHLLDNAIKFSDQGEIVIAVAVSEESPYHLTLQFSVTDQGCGIPRDRITTIFEPFTQAEDYLTRQYEGLGLGLAICTKLVQLMQGEIWVESQAGLGATFHFTVKVGKGAAEPQLAPA